MDYFLAFIGWSSTLMFLLGCGVIASFFANKIKLHNTSILFFWGGFFYGMFLICDLSIPSEEKVGWVGQYSFMAMLLFTKWWLVVPTLAGWGRIIWYLYITIYTDVKVIQEKNKLNKRRKDAEQII